ncbi:MAG: HlyD family efflux transporter periplasmic adaptor subunit [Gemmatales bacterium]|nr:HlyD family secretion protein [Gemmatales bacterium]MDW8176903.1 HlyD family efflux transporter periplasmic adaptor subunit [Gemmatales bacterium]
MSSEPRPSVEEQALEQTRQRIQRFLQELSQLAESALSPLEFFGEFLQRIVQGLSAVGAAFWTKTAQGNLQLQYHVNFPSLHLDAGEQVRASHDELMRQVATTARARLLPPMSGAAVSAGPANLTPYTLLLIPVLVERQLAAILEIWIDPNRPPSAQRGMMQLLAACAELAGRYLHHQQLRQVLGQQQVWGQLEAFARQAHGSLNPREVAYTVANEGRRIIECDRVSVATRLGQATYIEAVSGVDVVEKRSVLVRTMRELCHHVLDWGETLTYTGKKDESLPPQVLKALDAYLAESPSKILILLPLRDEREKDRKDRPPRSALLVEAFEPTVSAETLLARTEIIGRHAAPALYNALEYRRLPLRWLLVPMANVKDALRGRRLAIVGAIIGAILALFLVLFFVPYPLRLEAKGQLVPKDRQTIYAQVTGRVVRVERRNGEYVRAGDPLLFIEDREVLRRLSELEMQMKLADLRIAELSRETERATNHEEKNRLQEELFKQRASYYAALAQHTLLKRLTGGGLVVAPRQGEVVTPETEQLLGKVTKPGEPLLQVARREGDWHIEMYIPERHVGHIREAVVKNRGQPLEVDLLLATDPNRRYKGRLYPEGLGGAVTTHNNEPALFARVELVDISREQLDKMPVGAEVRAKVRCGYRSVGYVWFYELWEFLYENLIF